MRIHALTTGTVRVKHSFLFPSSGARRQLDLFLPGPVLTHHHGDHVDGLVHERAPAQINDAELRFAQTAFPTTPAAT
jgi:hypothetical protein